MVRIRVCRECENKIHPENGYDKNDILEKQERAKKVLNKKLKLKASDIMNPFFELIDERIMDIETSVKDIPKDLELTPRKISPALKKCEGRLKELKYMRNYVRENVNYTLHTNA